MPEEGSSNSNSSGSPSIAFAKLTCSQTTEGGKVKLHTLYRRHTQPELNPLILNIDMYIPPTVPCIFLMGLVERISLSIKACSS